MRAAAFRNQVTVGAGLSRPEMTNDERPRSSSSSQSEQDFRGLNDE